MNLNQKLRRLREEQELSLNKLAEIARVSKAYLSQLENNPKKQPSAEVLFRIASALGTTIADLLDKPVRVYAKDFHQEMPEGLRTLIDERGKRLDIREEDVTMLMNIEYRGKQPETPDEWEHVLQTIRIVVRE